MPARNGVRVGGILLHSGRTLMFFGPNYSLSAAKPRSRVTRRLESAPFWRFGLHDFDVWLPQCYWEWQMGVALN